MLIIIKSKENNDNYWLEVSIYVIVDMKTNIKKIFLSY